MAKYLAGRRHRPFDVTTFHYSLRRHFGRHFSNYTSQFGRMVGRTQNFDARHLSRRNAEIRRA